MTVNRGFGAWVDAEKYYIGTPPFLDCKIYPEFCRHEHLANSKTGSEQVLFGRDTLVSLITSLLCFCLQPFLNGVLMFDIRTISPTRNSAFFTLIFCEGLHGAIASAFSIFTNFFVSRSLTLTGAIPMLLFIRAFESFTDF